MFDRDIRQKSTVRLAIMPAPGNQNRHSQNTIFFAKIVDDLPEWIQHSYASLGVSGRQARDYVKELERAGLITVEQRGLRKTKVPNRPEDADDPGIEPGGARPERNSGSAPDRNGPAGLEARVHLAWAALT
jgi:hypothetical protein